MTGAVVTAVVTRQFLCSVCRMRGIFRAGGLLTARQ